MDKRVIKTYKAQENVQKLEIISVIKLIFRHLRPLWPYTTHACLLIKIRFERTRIRVNYINRHFWIKEKKILTDKSAIGI